MLAVGDECSCVASCVAVEITSSASPSQHTTIQTRLKDSVEQAVHVKARALVCWPQRDFSLAFSRVIHLRFVFKGSREAGRALFARRAVSRCYGDRSGKRRVASAATASAAGDDTQRGSQPLINGS